MTLSQKKPRDKFWPEMNLRRREFWSKKKKKKEREGTPPLIPTFTILLFQTGKNARERKAISNKNLTNSTITGILRHLLESLSPINNPVWHSCYCLWKATALGFILLYKKTEISPMQYAMHGYPCNLGYPVGPRLVVYS